MKTLLGYSWFNYSVNIRDMNEAWLARLRAAGFDVEGCCLTLNPPGGRLTWQKMDELWRRRDPELLRFYEQLGEKMSNYDVFVNFNGINLHPEFVRQIPAFTVYGCFDDPESSENLSKPVATSYDLCMVGNIAALDLYKSWGVKEPRWWPTGFRADDFDPRLTRDQILSGERDVPITMLCERKSGWRRERLDKFVSAFPNGTYYGPGWPAGFLPEEERVPLLQRTRIGINIHNSTGPINYRTFYLPANGVMQICDNKSHLGKIFELGREVAGYDSIEEAIDLCRYYEAHDEERRQIAAAGWERSTREYNEVEIFRRVETYVKESLERNAAPRPTGPIEITTEATASKNSVRGETAEQLRPGAATAILESASDEFRRDHKPTFYLHKDELYKPDKWWLRFDRLLRERYSLPVQHVNLLEDDIPALFNKVSPEDALLGRFGHNARDLERIRPIFGALNTAFGGKAFPAKADYDVYDNKAAQIELFQRRGYPMPLSCVAKTRSELDQFLATSGVTFPVVVKHSAGAGSVNVKLADSPEEIPLPSIVQEFCENNDRDVRINVIGDRVMGFERLNRPDDFRASGSGRIVYCDEFDPEVVQLAWRISRENGFTSMSYDFVRRNGQWVLLEISYAYMDSAVRDCKFFYEMPSGQRRDKRDVYPQDFIVADFLKTHYGIDTPLHVLCPHEIAASPATGQPAQRAGKPHVHIIADVPDWIFSRHARKIADGLQNEFEITIGYRGEDFNEDDFDLIYPLEFALIKPEKIRNPRKYITGIRSHCSWQKQGLEQVTTMLREKFQRVHVVSRRLQGIFQPHLPEVELLSHGVDTTLFTPTTRADLSGRGRLRIGWAGNRRSGSRKGFEDIIEPLGALPGVELVFCGYHDRLLTTEEMIRFYDSIDAYVCASDFEGNNNSLLEAGAMGRALITTDNGTVPEYLCNGESALIVERTPEAFVRAVEQLRDDPEMRARLGAAASKSVRAIFDWAVQMERHRSFFERSITEAAQPTTQATASDATLLDAIEQQAREALAVNPDGVEALKLLASVCLRQERWQEAAQCSARVLQQQADDIESLLILAKCFFKAGDVESTQLALERILEFDPNNAIARDNLKDLAAATSNPAAIPQNAEQLIRAGQKLLDDGNVPDAIRYLERAIELEPNDADLMVAVAGLHLSVENVEGARKLLSHALLVAPKHLEATDMLLDLALRESQDSTSGQSVTSTIPEQTAQFNELPRATAPIRNGTSEKAAQEEGNSAAFAHLQRGFDLLKERQFAAAQAETRTYQELVDYDALDRTDNRSEANPKVSVVIVAYNINQGLIQCLDSLAASENPPHEIIVVDNGGNESIHAELAKRDLLHIRVGFNSILAEGRNIGVHFARSNYAVFIDDDAIAAPGYIASALEGFEAFDVHAFRGKVLPKSEHPNNSRARHYDLGDLPFPADIDTEGNSAFRIDTWRKLGGQDPLLFGGEGVEFSYRIGKLHDDQPLMYWPFMVIQHDYAATDTKLENKSSRHVLMREYSVFKHPDLYTFHNGLVKFALSSEAKMEGHRMLRRRSNAEPVQPKTNTSSVAPGPFISICIPTYNRAEFIRGTIESALAQTYANFEIVVVDDGSTDNTAATVQAIKDPRVRYILKEHSGGPATRNRCWAEAKADFVVWLDSDDLIEPDTLARYAEQLVDDPTLDVLYGDLQVVDGNLKPGIIWVYKNYHGWRDALVSDMVVRNRIPNVCALVRKSCYEQIGGYDAAFRRAHDYEFWSRLAPVANFKHVNAIVARYRQHEQSLSKFDTQPDQSFETRVVKAMAERHGVANVFENFSATATEPKADEATGWLILSLVLLKLGDTAGTLEYLDKSVATAPLANAEHLRWLLRGLIDNRSAFRATPPNGWTRGTAKFHKLVETGIRAFRAGDPGRSARACTELTEIAPKAMETLLLTAFSLKRWGDFRPAQLAFDCLLIQQSEGVVQDFSGAEPAKSQTSPRPGLEAFLATVFDESIPSDAIASTHAFIQQAAAAQNTIEFLARHQEGVTPLFHALIGLTPGERSEWLENEERTAIETVRGALEADAESRRTRDKGFSFCIITNGRRTEKLNRQIASIRALNLPNYEILVGGVVSNVPQGVRTLEMESAARTGRLGHMRNSLARAARYDRLIVSDDDIIFASQFGKGLDRLGGLYEVVGARILNPDGSRFWDWAATGGTKGAALLDYWTADVDVYLTGGFCILNASVLNRVRWHEYLGFYQAEDVDFTKKLKQADVRIGFNPYCKVIHDDDRYSRVSQRVFLFDHMVETIEKDAMIWSTDELKFLAAQAARMAGNHADRRKLVSDLAARLNIDTSNFFRGNETTAKQKNQSPAKPPRKLEINWHGSFLDYGSLSNINRVLTDTLVIQNGASIRRIQTAPVAGKLAKPLQSYRGKLANKPNANASLTVRHAWPPDWSRPAHGKLAVIQPWEFGSLPKDWVTASANVDMFWVPSNYVRQVYLESGVPAEKVHVVPNGIDTKVFHPQVKPLPLATKKKFKFLFVGGTIHRKGPDALLKAYCESFTATDDVCLVIKDFGSGSVYAGQTIEQQIREFQKQLNAPEILYLTNELPERDLPGLYKACDCLVHPYRGEGFGLPVLEAMACGLPVIVTAGGATDDFVPAEIGYRIPSTRQVFGREISGMPLVGDGWLLEPDVDALKKLICHVVEHGDEARAKGKSGSEFVRENFTWNHTATRVAELAQKCQCAAGSLPAEETQKTAPTKPAKPIAIKLPRVARLGHLGAARELFNQGKMVPAWNAILDAIAQRPFHPAAYLLLAEIACQSGDGNRMKECVDRAQSLTPNWKPARNFVKTHKLRPAKSIVEFAPLPAVGEPRLSVCLITKNEEKFLDQCLRSIKDVAHQIVVMDTGSTDRTIDIAKQYGAEVHSFTWCDDFSAARNAALEKASGDWVLVLDADEELAPDSKAALRQAMQTPNTIGWRVPIIDVGREAEGRTFVARLFRNAPGLFYVSRVHEQVFSSVEVRREEWNMETGVAEASLIHHGYTAEVVKDRNKVARNLRLLEIAIEEIPDDPNLLMNYGLELIRSDRFDEGLQRYAEAFAALEAKPANEVTPELRESLLTQYTSHLMKVNRWSDIVAVLSSRVARAGKLTASLLFSLGLAHQELHQWTEAATAFRACIAARGEPSFYLVNQVIHSGAPRHCLALALWQSGAIEDAARAFTAALKEDPKLAPLRMDAARFEAKHRDAVEALKLFHGLVTENAQFTDAWIHGAQLAISQPDFIEFARDWTAEAIKHHPAHRELIAARGETLLLSQQYADALPFWRQLNGHPRALSARLFCELMQGEFTIGGPPGNEVETSQEFLNWYRRLVNFRAAEGVQAVGERLEYLATVLPSAARTLNRVLEQAAAEAA